MKILQHRRQHKIINERFGTEFTDADRLLFEQVSGDMAKDERLVSQAKANTKESRYFCESLFWASKPKQAAKT